MLICVVRPRGSSNNDYYVDYALPQPGKKGIKKALPEQRFRKGLFNLLTWLSAAVRA
jgi:hypothetical protein